MSNGFVRLCKPRAGDIGGNYGMVGAWLVALGSDT